MQPIVLEGTGLAESPLRELCGVGDENISCWREKKTKSEPSGLGGEGRRSLFHLSICLVPTIESKAEITIIFTLYKYYTIYAFREVIL